MSHSELIIATRESPLALWQANWVKSQLEHFHPGLQVTLLGMSTQADRLPYVSLADIGGKGLFVKELEYALLEGRAQLAVHCVKDMPVELPPGLILPVFCERESAQDAFVSTQYESLEALPQGAVVGTSSLRRQSQLLFLRPDLQVKKLRGNVATRLGKLDAGEYDAIILAAAGLNRLGLTARIRTLLSLEQFLPAMGQGILGLECLASDTATQALIAPLNHAATQSCALAERAVCQRLGVGCQVPVAAYAEIRHERLSVSGLVATLDGTIMLQASLEGRITDAAEMGIAVAESLLAQGAQDILLSL